ncbi:MAG: hypothetical protein KDJ90_24405, partial [Nitratireductor sp.]|nr:hypothetical protein [Nitratireductor sp.]
YLNQKGRGNSAALLMIRQTCWSVAAENRLHPRSQLGQSARKGGVTMHVHLFPDNIASAEIQIRKH